MPSGADAEAAAVKIQASMRGRAARKEVAALRAAGHLTSAEVDEVVALETMPEGPEAEAAALKIQAAARGRNARREVAQLKAAKGLTAAEVEALAEVVQMPEGPEAEAAAVKIQAAIRGRKARADVLAMKMAGQVDEEDAALLQELEAMPEGPEAEAAAVKIQATLRGRAVRRQVAALKEQAGVLVTEEEIALADQILEMPEGEDVEAAALKIQAAIRGRVARKEVAAMLAAKELSKEDAAAVKALESMADDAEANAAAIKIQSRVRGRAARKELEELKHDGGLDKALAEEITALEAMPEGPEAEAAALRIQAVARGRNARKEVAKLRTAGVLTAAEVDAVIALEQMPEGPEADAAARKIQAVARGRAARKEVAGLKEMALLDDLLAAPEAEGAALKIQAATRGRMARREVARLKAEGELTLAEEEALDMINALPEGPEVEEAAIKIQAFVRGRKARDEVAALRDSGKITGEEASNLLREMGVAESEELTLNLKTKREYNITGLGALADGYYDPEVLRREYDVARELPAGAAKLHHIFGLDTLRLNNSQYIEDGVLLHSVGNVIVFISVPSMEQKMVLEGIDGRGVGCVAIHPSGNYFASCEKAPAGKSPSVYIYEYPSLRLFRVLRGGTERAFSTACFDGEGEKLVTVGNAPDFMMTVWDWRHEATMLKSKAFGQEVSNVTFNKYVRGSLTTSGTGHVRFWKMASSFTGLKLQGEIGKFGNKEMSDINGYAELPDSKVLTGNEHGTLYMWDGQFIKIEIMREDNKPLHDGPIDVVMLVDDWKGQRVFLTGGADGYVRFWDFQALNDADTTDDMPNYWTVPVDEVFIGEGVHVTHVAMKDDHWIVQDGAGSLIRVDIDNGEFKETRTLLSHHSGRINWVSHSHKEHLCVTAGEDGTLRLWDYTNKRQLYSRKFGAPASYVKWISGLVDPTGRTVVAGFADGCLRTVQLTNEGFNLVDVCKPHNAPVTNVSMSTDGARLASGASDGSVFIFRRKDTKFVPLCFFEMDGPIRTVNWGDKRLLYAVLKDGAIYRINTPDEHDSTKSYRVADLDIESFALELPPDEEAEKAEREKAEKLAKEGDGNAGDAESDNEEEDEATKAPEPIGPLPASSFLYSREAGKFLFSVGGKGSGRILKGEMAWEDPLTGEKKSRTVDTKLVCSTATGVPVTFMGYSGRGDLFMTGSQDGTFSVRRIGGGKDRFGFPDAATDLGAIFNLADGNGGGAVMSLDASHDLSFVISVGTDGSMFAHQIDLANCNAASLEKVFYAFPRDKYAKDVLPSVDDITDPSTYSIEEDKLKTEEDIKRQAADRKKMSVREQINLLRADFDKLKKDNASKPVAERLPDSAFEIDPDMMNILAAKNAALLDQTAKELQFEKERKRLGLAKLKEAFLDPVDYERIIVKAFSLDPRDALQVATFRLPGLPESVKAAIADLHQSMDNFAITSESSGALDGEGDDEFKNGLGATQGSLAGSRVVSKADLRRLQRHKRKAEMEAFDLTRPDDKYEKAEDTRAIKEAQENLGDYKLKSSADYVVPAEKSQTAEKKYRQMLLLEESVYNIKKTFNERVLLLRDFKQRIIDDVVQGKQRLAEIKNELGGGEAELDEETGGNGLVRGEMDEDEVPDRRRKEMSKDDFRSYARRSDNHVPPELFDDADEDAEASASAPASSVKLSKKARIAQARNAALARGESRTMAELQGSDLRRSRMEIERSDIRKHLKASIASFNATVSLMRREKFKLEADLKASELKMLTFFEELAFLRDNEKGENALMAKKEKKMIEKSEILQKVADCQDKLDLKRLDVEAMIARKAALVDKFTKSVPSSLPFHDQLLKILNRKIKRAKKRDPDAEDDEDDEDDDDDDDDEDYDSEEEDEEEERCPDGCDPGMYSMVCDLREQRLDEEDFNAEVQKDIASLRTEKDNHAKKSKTVDAAMAQIDKEIAQFQKEKQLRLNEIDVLVTLKTHQITYLLVDSKNNVGLPATYEDGLLFSISKLDSLHDRIRELEDQKVVLRAGLKDLKKTHVQLLRDSRTISERIAELEGRAVEVQMLKFGGVIDLEAVDEVEERKGADDLIAALKQQEASQQRQLSEIEKRVEESRAGLAATTKLNTQLLKRVADLSASEILLERSLSNSSGSLFVDPEAKKREQIKARDELVGVINIQANDIEAMKREILSLRRKGGRVML